MGADGRRPRRQRVRCDRDSRGVLSGRRCGGCGGRLAAAGLRILWLAAAATAAPGPLAAPAAGGSCGLCGGWRRRTWMRMRTPLQMKTRLLWLAAAATAAPIAPAADRSCGCGSWCGWWRMRMRFLRLLRAGGGWAAAPVADGGCGSRRSCCRGCVYRPCGWQRIRMRLLPRGG